MKTVILRLASFLILVAATEAQAQFDYVTNADGASVTITGYSGPGAVLIPSAIDDLAVTDIGDYAFAVDNISSVRISDSVTNIGENAFDGCESLTNAEIPDSVIGIGYSAFGGSGLTSVTIPGSASNIGDGAFGSCGSLTNLIIASGLSSIQSNMFLGCSALPNVTIPATVTNIGVYAFASCDQLVQIHFTGNAPVVDSTVFADYRRQGEVDVPYYVVTAYYLPGTTGWAEFSSNTLIESNAYLPTNIFIPTVLWNPVIQVGGANFGVQSNQFGFNVTGTTNIPIVVEACTNLAQPAWVPLQSMTLTNGLVYFSEPVQPGSAGRFYRISAP